MSNKFVSDCCGAELKSMPPNPRRGETVNFICSDCNELCAPVQEEANDE